MKIDDTACDVHDEIKRFQVHNTPLTFQDLMEKNEIRGTVAGETITEKFKTATNVPIFKHISRD